MGALRQPIEDTILFLLERSYSPLNLPLKRMGYVPTAFIDYFLKILEEFSFGIITAQEAAEKRQNNATLMILEGN